MGSKRYKKGCAAVACDELNPEENKELCYIEEAMPGFTRKKWGRGFTYFDSQSRRIRDGAVRKRIKRLVIPPAWTDVWICPLAQGHIQVRGRDARGRRQYIYHPRWVEMRQRYKYDRLIDFGKALTRIRRQVDADLKRPKLDLDKVSAVAVALLDAARIRVGNREYERRNRSYGLTTLKDRHVEVRGSAILIEFTGKSGRHQRIDLADRRLARQVARCQELPGQEVFQYLDENGERRRLSSEDVNAYLGHASGKPFTAKDMRTWWGTVLMAEALQSPDTEDRKGGLGKQTARAVRKVAEALGNTAAVCRQYYIHPAVMAALESAGLADAFQWADRHPPGVRAEALSRTERAVLRFLQSGGNAPKKNS
ncbi:MAG: hypothetical protein WBY88_04000 [Desulfosarcina sp.]